MLIEVDHVKLDIDYLHIRNKTYYFVISVPKARHNEVKERQVWISLRTKEPKVAEERVRKHIRYYTILFERDGPITSTDLRNPKTIEALKEEFGDSAPHHTEYHKADTLQSLAWVKRNLEIMSRVASDTTKASAIRSVVWGGLEPTTIKLSQATDKYAEMNDGKFDDMSKSRREYKIFRWRNAVDALIEFCGDIEVTKITRRHASDFADWLNKKVKDEVWTIDTARGKLTFVSMIVRNVLDRVFDIQVNPFDKLQVGGEGRKRKKKVEKSIQPFSEIEMLTVNTLKHKFPEIRALMDVAECTGAGITELIYLDTDDVVLDGDYPHVKLRPNRYRAYLKNDNRPRELPLYSKALEAMRKYPNGFARYRSDRGAKNVSDAVSRILKKAGLDRSWNSFRHRFEDLLRWAKVPVDIRSVLMGHTEDVNPMDAEYGRGFNIGQKYDAIKKAFDHGQKLQMEEFEKQKD